MRNHSTYRKKQNKTRNAIALISILVVAVALLVYFNSPKTTRLKYDIFSLGDSWDAIVLFNEVHIDLPDNERIIFSVPNNSEVHAEDIIGEYYKKGYISSAFESYSELQQKIVAYQDDVLLKDIYENEINQYAIDISTVLTELKTYDSNKNDYIVLNERLIDLLNERQLYIRQNYPADETLQELYNEEQERLNALNDWINPIRSAGNGYVSWYVNADYNDLNTMTSTSLKASDIKELLQKGSIYKNINNSSEFSVRIISDEYIYLAFVATGDWTIGKQLVLYNDATEESIDASVVAVNGDGTEKCIILKADCEVADFLDHRVITISESPLFTGLTVDKNFILNDGSGDYILIEINENERRQVFVDVVASTERTAVIKATEEGLISQDTIVFDK